MLAFTVALFVPFGAAGAADAAGLTWPTALQSTAEITPQSGTFTNPNVAPGQTACWSATNCVAAGYDVVIGSSQITSAAPIITLITAGQPGTSVQVALPSPSASYDNGAQVAALASVACQSSGVCVAVGSYIDSAYDKQSFAVPIINGVIGTAVEVHAPSGAYANPLSSLNSISCPATGTCVAAGVYQDSSGNAQAFVVPITAGVVGTSQEVPLPVPEFDAGGINGSDGPSVACWASGACVLAGQYLDDQDNDVEFISSIAGGVPAAPSALTLPSDAHAADSTSDQVGQLNAVGCAASGTCLAVGYYTSSAHGHEPLAVAINDGQPVEPTAVTLPSDALSDTSPLEGTSLSSVACPVSGPCVAVGSYTATSSSAEPLIVEVSATGASTVIEPGLPSDAYSESSGNQNGALTTVTCPAAGSCLAGGFYTKPISSSSQPEGVVVGVSAGQAQTPQELALPANGTHLDATATSVGCASSGSCVLTGTYRSSDPADDGLVASLQAPLSVSTTSLPAGAIGTAYSQQLSASGAWGTYTWSVSSGSLPPGLSLNPQTGVISGTPTASSSGSFTVKVTGTGVPAQTATQALSIAVPVLASSGTLQLTPSVTPLLVPSVKLRVAGSGLREAAGLNGLTVLCSVVACTGSVNVLYTHRAAGKHKRVTTVIAFGTYTVAAGGSRALKLHLNSAGRRFLLDSSRLRLSVLLRVRVTGGSTASTHATLRYVQPKHG